MDSHFANKATVHCVAHASSEPVEVHSASSGGSSGDAKVNKRGSKRDSVASELSAAFASTSEAFLDEYKKAEAQKLQQISELTEVLKFFVDKL
jgi:hypothetical protein